MFTKHYIESDDMRKCVHKKIVCIESDDMRMCLHKILHRK